jgi:hypothetical protein
MTPNSKADLQRKLAIAPVANPPAGLADRIKNDIPRRIGLEAERERTQLRKSAVFNLRIAASIVVLVSSLYVVLHILSRSEPAPGSEAVKPQGVSAPLPRAAVMLPDIPPKPGSAREQPRSDLPALPNTPPPTSAAVAPVNRIAEATHTEAVEMNTQRPALADRVENDGLLSKKEQTTVVSAEQSAAAAPLPAPAPEQAAPVANAASAAFAPEERAAVKTEPRPGMMREAPSVRNFVAIQQAIERGESPRPIDTAAIVQHFAAPERAPADLRVEIEASATPLDPTKWLLRVSVDQPKPAGTVIHLAFGEAVTSHRALTGAPVPNETALYDIEFARDAKPDQVIATVHAGKTDAIVRVADLHKWTDASPRMKRASLAAAWARSLQSHTQANEIVIKARAAHIDDLADIAERTERNQ